MMNKDDSAVRRKKISEIGRLDNPKTFFPISLAGLSTIFLRQLMHY